MLAYMVAQQRLASYRLNEQGGHYTLATSAQPCCQCYGATVWAGIDTLLIGARAEDVEELTEFDEGPLPADWLRRTGTPRHFGTTRHPARAGARRAGCLRRHGGELLNRLRAALPLLLLIIAGIVLVSSGVFDRFHPERLVAHQQQVRAYIQDNPWMSRLVFIGLLTHGDMHRHPSHDCLDPGRRTRLRYRRRYDVFLDRAYARFADPVSRQPLCLRRRQQASAGDCGKTSSWFRTPSGESTRSSCDWCPSLHLAC